LSKIGRGQDFDPGDILDTDGLNDSEDEILKKFKENSPGPTLRKKSPIRRN